ncbi:hypothetical protein HHK36_016224 [Tetracentron sinense]|uniref:Protein FAR1-RELATED SEQUENCE n=1 Tax=Tetracentron sinense TaxID=13715 RepID=A0A834Z4W9_TETSI|nr:hypothetical protein HHK36_016224 [Tetracentron sinense]
MNPLACFSGNQDIASSSQKESFEALPIQPLFTERLLDLLDQDISNDEEVQHAENVLSEIIVISIGQVFNNDDLAHEYYCTFAKNYAGLPRQKNSDNGKDSRERKSSCCGCAAHMSVSLHVEGDLTSWRVISFSNDHNHELLDQREVRYLPAYRSISEYYRSRLLTFATTGMCVKEMIRLLEIEQQVKVGCLPFTQKDVRKFLNNSKNIDRDNDATKLVLMCKKMKDNDDDFKYDYTVDGENKLEHIAWSHGTSVYDYKHYGDVVVFETTYRLNAYGMPVGIWVGVNNHDQDLGLKEAIASEMPNTKHALCIWHIVSKFSGRFSTILGVRYNDWKTDFYRLYELESEDEFITGWSDMRQRDRQKRLQLEPRRERKMVSVVVELRDQVGEQQTMQQKYLNVNLKTATPIEEHASKVLTPYAFDLFQQEIVATFQYATIQIGVESWIVRYHSKQEGGRKVTFKNEDKMICCSCRGFEFVGIICRHSLSVLLKNNYFETPEQYLPIRWRREIPLPQKYSQDSPHGYKERYQVLQSIGLEVFKESAKSGERFNIAYNCLTNLFSNLKEMEPISIVEDIEVCDTSNDLEANLVDIPPTISILNLNHSITKGRPKEKRPK